DATLALFRDHGNAAATLAQGADEARAVLEAAAAAGVDVVAAGEQLQHDGLVLFEKAFAELLVLTA
nr:transaldolase [Vogesella sp.]